MADGILRSTAIATVSVVESLRVELETAEEQVFVLDANKPDKPMKSKEFSVRSNASGYPFDVWISVLSSTLDTNSNLYLATNGESTLPLKVLFHYKMDGQVLLTVNPALSQSGEIHTAKPISAKFIQHLKKKNDKKITCQIELVPFNKEGGEKRPPRPGTYKLLMFTNIGQEE